MGFGSERKGQDTQYASRKKGWAWLVIYPINALEAPVAHGVGSLHGLEYRGLFGSS